MRLCPEATYPATSKVCDFRLTEETVDEPAEKKGDPGTDGGQKKMVGNCVPRER